MLGLHYQLRLLFNRIRNRLRRQSFNWRPFSKSTFESDSQSTYYVEAVRKFLSDETSFRKFRKNFDYAEILEHVSPNLGEAYLNRIKAIAPELISKFDDFKKNDSVGSPFTFEFNGVGRLSPTTIRYVAVAAELLNLFGQELGDDIAEIGVGYGGQLRILTEIFNLQRVTLFDLPEVLSLSKKYLTQVGISEILEFGTLEKIPSEKAWDFVMSNYAFSELPIELQLEYLEKIILRSKKGYMIMNSGRQNVTGRSSGKLSLQELQKRIPKMQIFEEIPLTGPDNYVIAWGI